MGRAGGGGGHSSFGGSRSSMGHSGGGRSHTSSGRSGRTSSSYSRPSSSYSRPSSSYSRPSPGYSRPVHNHTTVYNNYGGPSYYDSSSYRSSSRHKHFASSFIGTMLAFFAICLLFYIMATVISAGSSSKTRSTVQREKISTGITDNGHLFTDTLDWVEDANGLTRSLNNFYKKTGVYPYVYIVDNIDGDTRIDNDKLEEKAEVLYNDLFDDQGHFLLLFMENSSGDWAYTSWMGGMCGTVMDSEACNILFDYIDAYYYSDRDTTRFFGDAFEDAADRIMKVDKKPLQTLMPAIILLIICGILCVVFKFISKSKQQKIEQTKANADLLKTDLNTLGTDALSDLKDKYN